VDTFLFALLLVFALSLGGRDQWLVAQWSDALGRSMPLLVLGMACAGLSAALMAWLGEGFAALLPPRAAQMLVAFALAIAGFELAWPVRHKPPPREPTRSLGAIAIVLLARQVGWSLTEPWILLSLALPGEDVHLIAEGLGRSAALRQTPVYVMEGNAQESDTRAVLEAQLDRLVFTEGGTGELLARTARREGPTAAPR
jgi:hypothetical protein